MTSLLCIAGVVFFAYAMGFKANRDNVEECTTRISALEAQVNDLEHRLSLEHEMRRELQKKLSR